MQIKRKQKVPKTPTGKPRAAAQPEPTQQKVAKPEVAAKKASGENEKEGEDSGSSDGTITVAFGRFNPPTVGHGKLLSAAKKAAAGGDLAIYPSRTQDPKKNPLDPDMKISFMKKMFPEYKDDIINDEEMKSIFNVLTSAGERGYKNVNIIVGSDRQSEFDNLAQKV